MISEIETGTNKLSLSATLIKERPMRPKPWIAILAMMFSFRRGSGVI